MSVGANLHFILSASSHDLLTFLPFFQTITTNFFYFVISPPFWDMRPSMVFLMISFISFFFGAPSKHANQIFFIYHG